MATEKGAAGSWGRSGRSRTRPGDGEGWGRDREREFLSLSARRDGCRCDARFAEQNPLVRIGLGLPLHKAVSSPVPRQDLRLLVVENEFAMIGLHRQDRMTVALLVAHDGDEQGLPWPTGLHEHAALEQDIVLAVAI